MAISRFLMVNDYFTFTIPETRILVNTYFTARIIKGMIYVDTGKFA